MILAALSLVDVCVYAFLALPCQNHNLKVYGMGRPLWRAARVFHEYPGAYSRPRATFFMPSSSFLISSGDNCGRSILIVSLLNFAVSGNGGR